MPDTVLTAQRRVYNGRRIRRGKLVHYWTVEGESGFYSLSPKQHRTWTHSILVHVGDVVEFQVAEDETFYVRGDHAPVIVDKVQKDTRDLWMVRDRAAFTSSRMAKKVRTFQDLVSPLREAYQSAPGPMKAAVLASIIQEVTR